MSEPLHVFDMMPSSFKDQQRWRSQIVLAIWLSVLGLVLIGLATLGLKLQAEERAQQLSQLQQQEQTLNLKNQTLQSRLAQRQRLQQQLQALQANNDVLSALQVSDQLSARFSIWLREWHWRHSEQNTALVRLQAIAPDHDSLSQLLTALNADQGIKAADIVESRLVTELGNQAVWFELLARQSSNTSGAGSTP